MNMESETNKFEVSDNSSAFDLFGLSNEQRNKFKNQVEKSNGLIRIFIHPLAHLNGPEKIENQDRVIKILSKNLYSEKAPPIIIMENEGGLENWKKSIEKLDLEKDVYLLETLRDYPYPILSDRPNPLEDSAEGILSTNGLKYAEDGCKKLISILKEAGVTELLVGGTSLKIIDGTLTQCVGNFIRFMQEFGDLNTKLSLGTAPINRSDIRDSHPELL